MQTEDGYLLTHFRIPHGRSGPTEGRRHPVILQHGILSASDLWILMGRERSLGNVRILFISHWLLLWGSSRINEHH